MPFADSGLCLLVPSSNDVVTEGTERQNNEDILGAGGSCFSPDSSAFGNISVQGIEGSGPTHVDGIARNIMGPSVGEWDIFTIFS